MPACLVVFNADDLGISSGTNEGIHAAVEAGLVRETSMCVTGGAVEEGARVARRLGERLGVGLHLSLTLGTALAGPIPGLTDAQGRFPPLKRALAACWSGRPRVDALAAEIRAQLARLAALGFTPTHINGHHHVHAFPTVRAALLEVLRASPVPYVRVPDEPAWTGARFSARRMLLGGMGRALARDARRAGVALGALPFRGLALHGRHDHRARLLALAEREALPAVEWMVHPRAPDPDFARLDHLAEDSYADHAAELATLTDPTLVAALRARGVEPVGYPRVSGAQAGCASAASGEVGRS